MSLKKKEAATRKYLDWADKNKEDMAHNLNTAQHLIDAIKLNVEIVCPMCKGDGKYFTIYAVFSEKTCEICEGTGKI